MKKIAGIIGILVLFSSLGFAQSYEKSEHGVNVQVNSTDIAIEFYSPSIVRVVKSPEGKKVEKEEGSRFTDFDDAGERCYKLPVQFYAYDCNGLLA